MPFQVTCAIIIFYFGYQDIAQIPGSEVMKSEGETTVDEVIIR